MKSLRRKIAFVFNHPYFLGGGEKSFFELIRIIDKELFEPIVMTPEKGEIEKACHEQGIEVCVTPFPSLKPSLFASPARSLLRLMEVLKAVTPDIIHVNGSRACLYAAMAGRMVGIPVVWHVRETIQDLFLYDGFLGALSKTIICVSKGVARKRFARFGGPINKKIAVVYNGVDTEIFTMKEGTRQRARKHLGLGDDILFGIVGNLVPLKGQDFFLRALGKVKERRPDCSIKVLIIGRPLDQSFSDMIRQMVADTHMTGQVLFRPYCEQITDILSALDVFVLPSRREGFSRSLLEAMSFALPVLASNIGVIAEAAPDGDNAILVDFGDEEEMASGIIKMCEDPMLRQKMGERNRSRVVAQFGLTSHVESIQGIYNRLLTQRP
ncbi:MAG: glycosyltransferase family 4 protein [Thermodesulfobacteriota bacterium]|nr:glycosyltransferase family 4 protein [Thermodesulfobacteriota bacterium]